MLLCLGAPWWLPKTTPDFTWLLERKKTLMACTMLRRFGGCCWAAPHYYSEWPWVKYLLHGFPKVGLTLHDDSKRKKTLWPATFHRGGVFFWHAPLLLWMLLCLGAIWWLPKSRSDFTWRLERKKAFMACKVVHGGGVFLWHAPLLL